MAATTQIDLNKGWEVERASCDEVGLRSPGEIAGFGHINKPIFLSEISLNGAKELLHESNGEMLSIENSLDTLEKMAEMPSVETFICILQRCRKKKSLAYAKRAHLLIYDNGLDAYATLGNFLVPMFVQCGSVFDAQRIFHRLVHRNEHSWTSLIQGYIESGLSQHALCMLQKMQEDCVHPSRYTFLVLLKACARLKCIERGREIHVDIVEGGLEGDLFVGNTLVDFYAKCGSLKEAWDVFGKLPFRDVVSWNALMAGLAEHSNGKEVLKCLEQMEREGVSADALTFLSCLKSCNNLGVLEKGLEMHFEIVKEGFEKDTFISSTLVGMYAKLGLLVEAQELFDELPARDVVSWTALITGYADHGLGEQALSSLEQMHKEGVNPDALTLVCCLKVSGNTGAVDKGQEIHAGIIMEGFEHDPFVGSTLIDIYAKFGMFVEAWEVLQELPDRDVVSWTALIAGYTEQGLGVEGLDCFEQMQLEGVLPNAVTYICSLKACASLGAIDRGQEIHADIVIEAIEGDLFVGNSLVDMYAKCGLVVEAQEVLDKLPNHDIISWNALISGYAEHGLGKEVLSCLEQMQAEDILPSAITFICSLKACGNLGAIDRGYKIHTMIANEGFEKDPLVGNTLVDMYAKCGLLVEAQEVFDEMTVQDVICRTSLISGYAEHMLYEEALDCMEHMKGVTPDAVVFVCSLKACGSIGAIDRGQEIHAEVAKEGFEKYPFLGNTLVDMYAKCGLLAEAKAVFDNLPGHDVVSWTALIAGYAEHGPCEEALKCLNHMQLEGGYPDVILWSAVILGYAEQKESDIVFSLYAQMQEQCLSPNIVTFMSILKLCGNTAALGSGRRIHAQVYGVGIGATDVAMAMALIDMYGKCGSMVDAQQVFDAMPSRDCKGWNALIAGYTRQGVSELVFYLFEKMIEEGTQPDEITFLSIYTLCNHGGLVDMGQRYFEDISKKYSIIPTTEHYNCMVDLFSRAGQFHEAVRMLEKMPFQPDLVTWITLLSACQKWGHVELSRQAFEHVVRLNENNAAAFILMSNVCVDVED